MQKSQTTIPVTVNLVDVLFTVLDRRNKLVPDLGQKDFQIELSKEAHFFQKEGFFN